ncbi:serine protease [Acaryochloris sp. IP29b_bin.137]|uniref:S1 family peptidase n=1 Tax=Acaryochloris sp. IP29b_bin.137 TaxID=2969217 RepID=UPI002614CB56|nr:serine protease [Acaryochloris sp. IP29b_bin.137]
MPGLPQGSAVCAPPISALLWTANLDRLQDHPPSNRSIQWLRHRAQAITATVWVDQRWSSGVVIQRQGMVYTVVTNQHVVNSGEAFWVTMPDGKRYEAELKSHAGLTGQDLAVLKFRSREVVYLTAILAPSLKLVPGTPVFASGFPIAQQSPQFRFTTGHISLVSDKVLQGGYQVGYTNPIEKGMSGGPVLNRQGQVVAINGMHAYPLWGNPYIFTDGSRPSAEELKVMQKSSWAIPSERLRHLFPAVFSINRHEE